MSLGNNNIKFFLFLIVILMIMSVINVIFNGYCINSLKNETLASSEIKEKLTRMNYASVAFSGLMAILSGVLLYLLKRSNDNNGDITFNPVRRFRSQHPQQAQSSFITSKDGSFKRMDHGIDPYNRED